MAASGIGFALLVIFVQMGFYGAVRGTAVGVTSQLDADLIMVSPAFVQILDTGTFDRSRLFQAMAASEVESATPLHLRYVNWHDPSSGENCRLLALGFPVASARETSLFKMGGVVDQLDALAPTGSMLLDRLTQNKCGPASPTRVVEVNDQITRVAGDFEMGVGFLADGSVLMSDNSFERLFTHHSLDQPHLGLLKISPGADPDEVAEQLRSQLPADVRILTADELRQIQETFWIRNTAVGNIFGLGSLAGFLVGVVVLFQILSADIRNHLPLYATLRAMGYSGRRLSFFVLEQSWIFAGLGYLPALLMSSLLFPAVHALTKLPIYMTFGLASGIAVLSALMCSLAALLSMQKLRSADPAELF
ncbi:hypothetical protein MK280_05970 [Myxococcota bacterium]|nr:hypothetical protein [Myxococcota bacterium]